MRIGINHVPEHRDPEEWGNILLDYGCSAVSFPVDHTAPLSLIDQYAKAARDRNIMIAEVGIWDSPFSPDPQAADRAKKRCEEQLALADYIKARCCVNVSGAFGECWYGCYQENFKEESYQKVVTFLQGLCDRVKPKDTCFTLESMQWMVPDSPEQYLKLIKDVDRKAFAVHLDGINFIKDPYTYTHQRELFDRCFQLLSPYIKSCHVKDCLLGEASTVNIREVPLGEGAVEAGYYLAQIDKLDGDMPVLVEHLSAMEEYRKGISYVKNLYADICADKSI